LLPDEKYEFCFGVNAGENAVMVPNSVEQALYLKERSVRYWESREFPYNRIQVPDTMIQALLNSSVRNIFQAREIKDGLPAYQVGPTCYRGLWMVDGAFLMESMTFLGQIEDVRNGMEYMMSFQNSDGSFETWKELWKETGNVLWAVTRHARLTDDKEWLNQHWSDLERAFNFMDTLRLRASVDRDAPNYGLIPAGRSDGGLWELKPEYANIYWILSGMKAAVDAADWLGKKETYLQWKQRYERMYDRFTEAALRDQKKDRYGNTYVPVYMIENDSILPQKAQWAFLHAVFPGKIFEENNSIVNGNMAMLKSAEKEGLVYSTGWHADGIWNYFGSFYGHALLWTGKGKEAADKLYAMANHAAPTLVWREEQNLKGSDEYHPVGDMPHNWASAEFIRLTRHLIALERGNELHLFEGLPQEWSKPGMTTSLTDIYTEFGVLTLKLNITEDGRNAVVNVDMKPHPDSVLDTIIIHTGGINQKDKTISLSPDFPLEYKIDL